MLKKFNYLLIFTLLFSQKNIAQEVDYNNHQLQFKQPPAFQQYAGYTTFDMAAIATMDDNDFDTNLPYIIKFGTLTQTTESNEFHVLTIINRFSGKFTSDKALTVNLSATTNVYDKYGTLVKGFFVDKPDVVITLDASLNKEERNNAKLVRQKTIEKITERLLGDFLNTMNGQMASLRFELAGLDGVKKKPELAEFSKTIKDVKNDVSKEELIAALSPSVAYWEKMIDYAGDADLVEVKRAAYQNLSIYNIVSGNIEKANSYIEKYKEIDKVHKTLMGLSKVKHSDNCEKLIAEMNVAPTAAAEVDATAALVSLQSIKDNYKYANIMGTVVVDARKIGGTYKGKIQVSKIDKPSGGGILNLDAASADVIITTKDENGKEKIINTDLSKITSLKDDAGVAYEIKKYGTMGLGDGVRYNLLKSNYVGTKITVFTTIIPAGSIDYVVKKTGDEKGIKSSLFNAKKQLIDYLSDCPTLTQMLKDGTIKGVNKIAEAYENCGK